VRVNDTFVFEDLNSTNGSWINGQRLPAGTSCPVTSGDQIWLGQFKLLICFHQDSVASADSTIILHDTSPNTDTLTPDILLERIGPFLKALDTLQKVAARCLNEGEETLTIKSINANNDAFFVIHLSNHPQAAQLVKKWKIHPVERARERAGLANVVNAANPGHRALQPQAKTAVRHAAKAAQIDVPLVMAPAAAWCFSMAAANRSGSLMRSLPPMISPYPSGASRSTLLHTSGRPGHGSM
jgi:predicted component of type VI protein secretion system